MYMEMDLIFQWRMRISDVHNSREESKLERVNDSPLVNMSLSDTHMLIFYYPYKIDYIVQ